MSSALVVNASPLILLARIERLDLLTLLVEKIIVPEGVLKEVEAGSKRDEAATAVKALARAKIVPDREVPNRIQLWDLGPGESQVLSHAIARDGSEAILDDRAARRCARVLGIPYTGTMGIVIRCRRRGLIPAARPLLKALQEQGIHLTQALIEDALAEVGE